MFTPIKLSRGKKKRIISAKVFLHSVGELVSRIAERGNKEMYVSALSRLHFVPNIAAPEDEDEEMDVIEDDAETTEVPMVVPALAT